MRDFFKGVAQNAAWDLLKWGGLFILSTLLSGGFTFRWDFLGLVPTYGGWLAFFGYGLMVIGALSIGWIITRPLRLQIDLDWLKSDKPSLVCAHTWNQIVPVKAIEVVEGDSELELTTDFEKVISAYELAFEEEIVVAIIDINNNPGNRTQKSIALDVSAHLDYYDMNGRHLFHINYGRWWEIDTPLFPEKAEDLKQYRKVNIYPGEIQRLPIAYKQVKGNIIYAYKYNSHIEMAKQRTKYKLGRSPTKVSVVFEGTNLKPTPPIKFLVRPWNDGIWLRRIGRLGRYLQP